VGIVPLNSFRGTCILHLPLLVLDFYSLELTVSTPLKQLELKEQMDEIEALLESK